MHQDRAIQSETAPDRNRFNAGPVGEMLLVSSADVCVIFNPAAGRGRAKQRIESLRRTLRSRAQFWTTHSPEHAEKLAFQAAQSGFGIVAAAGGDGTVHEVANGLLR